jgi:hypothetical protein
MDLSLCNLFADVGTKNGPTCRKFCLARARPSHRCTSPCLCLLRELVSGHIRQIIGHLRQTKVLIAIRAVDGH